MTARGAVPQETAAAASPALRLVRGATALGILVALTAQFLFGSDFPMFSALNFFSYFTVLSNVSAMVVLGVLAARPELEGDRVTSLARGAVTLYMAVTGIVYNLLLAPVAADVSTNLQWVNVIVHVVGPIVVVVDYLLAPPPLRPTVTETATWLVFPALWLVYTMVRGPIAEWYPYPFLDPDQESTGSIIVTCAGILVAFVVLAVLLRQRAGRAGVGDGR